MSYSHLAIHRERGKRAGNMPHPPQFAPGNLVSGLEVIKVLGRKKITDKSVWEYLVRCSNCATERTAIQATLQGYQRDCSTKSCACRVGVSSAEYRVVDMLHDWGYTPDKAPGNILWERYC